MHLSHLHYLPLGLPFFSVLAGLLVLLAAMLQVGVLQYAYLRLGVSSGMAVALLLGSLLGSYFNIPVGQLPGQHVTTGEEITFWGMHYVVPMTVEWPGTVIAVNLGGAVIPAAMSIYLLAKHRLWVRGPVATVSVAAICHALAKPVPAFGIALPIFVPALAAAAVALLLSRRYAAPLAYLGGSLGALIGADLLNLDKIAGLGAPIASIGGAGTFDGIFVTGITAVIIASISTGIERAAEDRRNGATRSASASHTGIR